MATTAALINETLTINQGDSLVKEYVLTDQAGVLVDDATALYSLCAKASLSDADPGVFTVTATQTTAGTAFLTIAPANTATLVPPAVLSYDVRCEETSGRVTTLARGKLIVLTPVNGSP